MSLVGAAIFPLTLLGGIYHALLGGIYHAKTKQIGLILISFTICIVLVAYARGYEINRQYDLFFVLTLAAVLVGAMLPGDDPKIRQGVTKIFVAFFIGIFLINLLFGDLLNYRPGEDFNDYQAISRVSGVLFCIITYYSLSVKSRMLSVVLLTTSVGLAFICISGGGRGELIASFIAILPVVVQKKGRGMIVLLAALILITIYWESLIELRGLTRLLNAFETRNSGMRIELGLEAFAIFTSDLKTFLFGCGINCFQALQGYEYGLYPHNYILEALVTFGLIGTLPILVVVARILFRWLTETNNEDYLLLIVACFFIFVSLKSGALISSFLATFLIVYVGSSLSNRRKPQRANRKRRTPGRIG